MPSLSPDSLRQDTSGVQKPIVYYFARDLFFGVRLAEGLTRLHVDARQFPSVPDEHVQQIAALALVDLSAPIAQWQPLIEAARASDVPVLAFGSHMDQERWQHARSLGATHIVANSQLIAHFPALVRRMMRPLPTQLQGSPAPGTLSACS